MEETFMQETFLEEALLRETALFHNLSAEETHTVLSCLSPNIVTRPKSSYLLQAGDCTNKLGLLLSGKAYIVQEDVWGHQNMIAKLYPNDTFAEAFAVSKESRLNVSVIAEEDCKVMWINAVQMLTQCAKNCPAHIRLTQNFVTILAKKNLQLNDKITHMSKRSTREKLLSYLSGEALRQGSLSFTIPYNRQQLADFLCVERAAMSSELSKLQRDGFLHYNRNYFNLHSAAFSWRHKS